MYKRTTSRNTSRVTWSRTPPPSSRPNVGGKRGAAGKVVLAPSTAPAPWSSFRRIENGLYGGRSATRLVSIVTQAFPTYQALLPAMHIRCCIRIAFPLSMPPFFLRARALARHFQRRKRSKDINRTSGALNATFEMHRREWSDFASETYAASKACGVLWFTTTAMARERAFMCHSCASGRTYRRPKPAPARSVYSQRREWSIRTLNAPFACFAPAGVALCGTVAQCANGWHPLLLRCLPATKPARFGHLMDARAAGCEVQWVCV